jgi:hypothetical protein
MKRFALAAICTVAMAGWVVAEEFTLTITKISDDGTQVTGYKQKAGGKGGGKGGFGGGFGKGEEVTLKITANAEVYKGKFDMDAKGLVKDGDNLKLAGLKEALANATPASFSVGGNKLSDNDKLEVAVKDGKYAVKLNGKDVDISTVTYTPRGNVTAKVTTDSNDAITQVIIGGGGGGKGKGKGGN